jgi:hypothetical protein
MPLPQDDYDFSSSLSTDELKEVTCVRCGGVAVKYGGEVLLEEAVAAAGW